MIGLFALAAAAAAPAPPLTCRPIAGAERLWASRETQWVLFGEMHGTREIPDTFIDMICLAAKKRGPVAVALEYPIGMQPLIDAWMESDGGMAARAAFMQWPEWRDPYQSGRTSIAVLRMFERLRVLKRVGVVRTVRAFDVPLDGPTGFERNALMAAHLRTIAAETKVLTLVLVGNVHSARMPFMVGPEEYRPAAFFLPEAGRVSVVITAPGGSSWGCGPKGCRVYDDPAGPVRLEGVFPDRAPEHRYDYRLELGRPTTASEPAVPGIATTVPLR